MIVLKILMFISLILFLAYIFVGIIITHRRNEKIYKRLDELEKEQGK